MLVSLSIERSTVAVPGGAMRAKLRDEQGWKDLTIAIDIMLAKHCFERQNRHEAVRSMCRVVKKWVNSELFFFFERLTPNTVKSTSELRSLVPSQNTRALARWQVKISDADPFALPPPTPKLQHHLDKNQYTQPRRKPHGTCESQFHASQLQLTGGA
jgi:hypothetical protein